MALSSRNHGVVYLAMGRPYLAMALLSFKSLRKFHEDLHVTILTNVKNVTFKESGLSIVHVDLETASNRDIKVNIIDYVNYDKFLFIDSDTIVMNKLDIAWVLLDYYDIALRLNPYPQLRKGKGDINILGHQVSDFPHWNSGVVLIRNNSRSKLFFKEWDFNFKEIGSQYDQVSLVPTIFQSNARVLSLDARWNASSPLIFGMKSWRKVTNIFHYASNISDCLAAQIIRADLLINDVSSDDSYRFIKKKREQKIENLGFIRYALARFYWMVVCPLSRPIL